jgi:hypothetical protein
MIKLLKTIIKIIKDYKISIIFILSYEIIYFLLGYKGFNFSFSKNKKMTNTIPCPFYFLHRIKKNINFNNVDGFIDFGSGYGRIVFFFSRKFILKNILGIESEYLPYISCINNFGNNSRVEFLNKNFNDFDIYKHFKTKKLKGLCLFFSAPFSDPKDLIIYINKIKSNLMIQNLIIVTVNYKYDDIKKINKIKILYRYYLSRNRGFCIFAF